MLALLALKGTIVTIDAMGEAGQRFRLAKPSGMASGGCQREIAKQIGDQGGDDVLALNGNQGTLCDDVRLFLDDPAREPGPTSSSTDGDHGRIETKTATVSTAIEWLKNDHPWPGLAAIGKVTRTPESKTKTSIETALYLLSTPLTAGRLNDVARAHWGIENTLHWVLDVTMNEDQTRNRLDNGPENLAILRHMALNILTADNAKISKRRKFKRAGWSNEYLRKILVTI